MVEADVEVEEGWAREVEGRRDDDADILESYRVSKVQLVGDDDSWPTLLSAIVALMPCWNTSEGHASEHHIVYKLLAQR